MGTEDSSSLQPIATQVKDATCLGCSCLCDDIVLSVSDGRIVEAEHACELGRDWFLTSRGPPVPATLEGKPATVEEALEAAARILGSARSPVVLGLNGATIEAQSEAVAIADRIGAAIDFGLVPTARLETRAFQRVGRVSSTLGEVKNRADVVVFWGVDPVRTHPRHWERYSVEPAGRFVPDGRAGRTILVADSQETATASRADRRLPVRPDAQFEVLWSLRAIVNGTKIDPQRAERSTGLGWESLAQWGRLLENARYGVVFYGEDLSHGRGGQAVVEAMFALVRDLNKTRRFVALSMGSPGNPSGAESVLAWQSGFPAGVDFHRGYPRSLPGESAHDLLGRGGADAALIVADDLPSDLKTRLQDVATIMVSTDLARFHSSRVAIRSATPGIDEGGTVARCDGVMLPLRSVMVSDFPDQRTLLEGIRRRLLA